VSSAHDDARRSVASEPRQVAHGTGEAIDDVTVGVDPLKVGDSTDSLAGDPVRLRLDRPRVVGSRDQRVVIERPRHFQSIAAHRHRTEKRT